ncbi:DUT, partial [Cervus elaphus hippelaphus]
EGEAKAAARFETLSAQLPRRACRQPEGSRGAASVRPSSDGGSYCFRGHWAGARLHELRQAAPKLGQMTSLCPRPVLGYRFFPSLLSSVFNGARRARPGAEAAGLSGSGPPLDPTPRGSVLLPALRLLSSGRNLSRSGRGSSNVGAQAGSTRFPRRGEAGSSAGCPRARHRAGELAGGSAGPEEVVRLRAVVIFYQRMLRELLYLNTSIFHYFPSAYDYTLPPMEKVLVKTDIQIALPSGCYGRVAPRSGLAAKHFIDVGAGVIDEDYRGNVGVVLFNFGKEKFEVKKGDRIAQLICERIFYPEIEEVQVSIIKAE